MMQLSLDDNVPRAIYGAETVHGRQVYRYFLNWPTGMMNERMGLGIFANPSTATETQTDPTVRRWIDYCRRWGLGWAGVCNVRAWRETDPKKVPGDPTAIGPENDKHILEAARAAKIVVCGWGKLGGTRGLHVLRLLQQNGIKRYALKFNADGSPAHPLYLRRDLKPTLMPKIALCDNGHHVLTLGCAGCRLLVSPL